MGNRQEIKKVHCLKCGDEWVCCRETNGTFQAGDVLVIPGRPKLKESITIAAGRVLIAISLLLLMWSAYLLFYLNERGWNSIGLSHLLLLALGAGLIIGVALWFVKQLRRLTTGRK